MEAREDLERRIRERGVRVEERLAILELLVRQDGDAELAQRREALLESVRKAGEKLRGRAG